MKLVFSCGVCGKQETIFLTDKSRTYLIGRELENLDVKLCADEKGSLSRIQANIKWDKNCWRLYDGWPPDTTAKHPIAMNKPASFGGTFVKRNDEIKNIPYGAGEEIKDKDTLLFVVTAKARTTAEKFIKQSPSDTQAVYYKYDGMVFREDMEYYDGFKYKCEVTDGTDDSVLRPSNMFAPTVTGELKPGLEYPNSCIGLDIRSSTEADLETQRDHMIPQFNEILGDLLKDYRDYLLILLGDGAFVCFLGNREDADVNFSFGLKFMDRLKTLNEENKRNKLAEWKIRIGVNNGKDRLVKVNIAGQEALNVYGNCITTMSRLMAYAKSKPGEIITGIPFHQENNNKKFYKNNFTQVSGEAVDKNGVKQLYYLYSKK
ncbi:MAG: hypothetical protein JXR81_10140 [Candidatus Goldbacteria bacterium]|nr:hypothetical protein [Candidatus Goldiibacteriota bacterium]